MSDYVADVPKGESQALDKVSKNKGEEIRKELWEELEVMV